MPIKVTSHQLCYYTAIHHPPSTYIYTTPATSGSVSLQLQPTSLPGPGVREDDCVCSENNNSAVIAVSAVSLLLIVTLITVILTQCLLILRMRRSIIKTSAEYMNPTTMHMDVPVSPNEAYAVHKTIEETTYETVK